MSQNQALTEYLLRLADTDMVLAQRLCEWCGKAPALEEEVAMMNVGLDLLGQARNWYDYAADLLDDGRDADQLAFRRNEREYRNLLLAEYPRGDYAVTTAKQFFFDVWHHLVLTRLSKSSDERIAGLAAKGLKEARYHRRRSTEWMLRLGRALKKATAASPTPCRTCGASPTSSPTPTPWKTSSRKPASAPAAWATPGGRK